MVNAIFDFCVLVLLSLADLFGMTYKAINVWIFVVIWPVFTLALIAVVVWQWLKIRRLQGEPTKENRQGARR
jgi:predicted signal transduction protein with EAL and GGDEF domain